MAIEIDLFVQRIEKLGKLTSTMKELAPNSITELTEIETKLASLASVVKEDKCLNAGGKFEWIDSVLVKVKLKCLDFSLLRHFRLRTN